MGALDEMLRELLTPLMPAWSTGTPEEYCAAAGMLATLEGGVIVGGLRLEVKIEPYVEEEDE